MARRIQRKVPSPPPARSAPQTPTLLARSMSAAAEKLRRGSLKGEVITGRFVADDPWVVPVLQTIAEHDEARALTRLGNLLRGNPFLLQHPYVFDQFRHLFTVWSTVEPDITDRANTWLRKLITAWAEGMTLGWKVAIEPPPRRRGRPPRLFPHLGQRDGWVLSEQDSPERMRAWRFRYLYDDLMAQLKACLRWKAYRNDYREYHGHPARRRQYAEAHMQGAQEVRETFDSFLKAWNAMEMKSSPLSNDDLERIIDRAFQVRVRGNPRHWVACGLLATITWSRANGVTLSLTPKQIDSTLKTLHKYGIGGQRPR